nr:hypothetical protein CFP56_41395 [Quercus suber]
MIKCSLIPVVLRYCSASRHAVPSTAPRRDQCAAPFDVNLVLLVLEERVLLGHLIEHLINDIHFPTFISRHLVRMGFLPPMVRAPRPHVILTLPDGQPLLHEQRALSTFPPTRPRLVLEPLHILPVLRRRLDHAQLILHVTSARLRPVRPQQVRVQVVGVMLHDGRRPGEIHKYVVFVAPERTGATWPHEARDLRPEPAVVEPMHGLPGRDAVDAPRGEEGAAALRATFVIFRVAVGGDFAVGLLDHDGRGIGADGAREVLAELSRHDAGAATEVESEVLGSSVVGEDGIVERRRGYVAKGVAGLPTSLDLYVHMLSSRKSRHRKHRVDAIAELAWSRESTSDQRTRLAHLGLGPHLNPIFGDDDTNRIDWQRLEFVACEVVK